MELLSPAGNRDAFDAAIACGADAVYLGYTSFGARSYAGNFDDNSLHEAIEYAHERDRKIYVTVNTLVKENELPDLRRMLGTLEKLGVDAVLVQDFGVAKLILEEFPALSLHASTQMTVHNKQGALMLKNLGFSRVVPARECSLEEISKIVSTGIETEVFGHGALCVSVSGQCLFSSLIGGRSGNRGKCAQPCRMLYRLNGEKEAFFLSTKDLMLLDSIPLLMRMGIASLKLEGRMKRPEYVAAVTLAYRRAIDAAESGQDFRVDDALREEMLQIFNRGGFTHGYLLGENHAALMSTEHAGHQGVLVGTLSHIDGGFATIIAERPMYPTDSLQIRLKKDWDFSYNGKEVPSGTTVRIRLPEGCQPSAGTKVYRLTDAQQIKMLQEFIREGMEEQIPVSAVLRAVPGEPALLEFSDSLGHTGSAYSKELVQKADVHPLDSETAREKIGKLGGTPYQLSDLTVEGEGGFLSVSGLNAMRREAIRALRDKRVKKEQTLRPVMQFPKAMSPKPERLLAASSNHPENAAMLLSAGADFFIWKTDTLIPEEMEEELAKCSESIALELPAFTFSQSVEEIRQFVSRHRDQIRAVVINNIGQLDTDWPCALWGGQGLNVMNSESARFCESFGIQILTASCELNATELQALISEGGCFLLQAYGRQQLMLLSHCPIRTQAGDKRTDNKCRRCDANGGKPAFYTDRKRYRFPLQRIRRREGCLIRLYNSAITDVSPHWKKVANLQAGFRLDFWDEKPERQKEITASFRQLMRCRKTGHIPDVQITSGHMLRGVQ